ncbi:MAG TPA: hypothetical protein VMU66_00945, partial [Gaiellales bacterium]|nr:hypothetical protein [Gaiellales bacterium]
MIRPAGAADGEQPAPRRAAWRRETHASDELPILFEAAGITFRGADWGGLRATVNSSPAGLDATPFLHGLPDDQCSCPHWSYVVKGRLRVSYADREGACATGDLYYMPPGHPFLVEVVRFAGGAALDQYRRESRRRVLPPAPHPTCRSAGPDVRRSRGPRCRERSPGRDQPGPAVDLV